MALVEIIPSHRQYNVSPRMEEIDGVGKERFSFPQVKNTARVKENNLRFSKTTHMWFWIGVSALIGSGVVSLAGVVFENDITSFAGAITLAVSLISLNNWIHSAHDEKV